MAKFTGGCLCGSVRYEVDADPVRAAQCHCDDCRRSTGAAFATNAFFKAEDIKVVKGETKSFQHKTDAGNTMTREFCPNCGSPLFGSTTRAPGIKNIRMGTMDNVGDIRPQIEVYAKRKLPFINLLDDTKHFDTMPPA